MHTDLHPTRLALLYLLLFAAIGCYTPWIPTFLADRGLSAGAIGLALALATVSRIVVPPLSGQWADRLRDPRRLMTAAALLAALDMTLLSWSRERNVIFALLALYGLATVPILPMIEAQTMRTLRNAPFNYGRIRVWGSLGFIVTALLSGSIGRRWGIATVPLTIAILFLLLALSVWTTRAAEASAPAAAESRAARRWRWRPLLPIWIATALGQASHGPYYAFFTLQLRERGVGPFAAGLLWSLAVVAEIGFMALAPRWFRRFDPLTTMRWALALSALRWIVLAIGLPLGVIAVTQLAHAASFGALHLSSIQLTDRLTPRGAKMRGQAWLTVFSSGLGSGTGLMLAGLFATRFDGAQLYVGASLLAALALLFPSRTRLAIMRAEGDRS